jgi:hypothetical protein
MRNPWGISVDIEIALQLPSDSQPREQRWLGDLVVPQDVADGILANTANATAQRTLAAYGLDTMQRSKLACTSEERTWLRVIIAP